jgi:hypothetical protein
MKRTACRYSSVILAVTVLVLIAGMAGHAAADNRGGFYLGLNFANQGGDMEQVGRDLGRELEAEIGGNWATSKGSITGLGLGGYYLIEHTPTVGFQVEAQYIRRGTKLTLDGTGIPAAVPPNVSMDALFKIDYLEVPLLVRFSPSPEAKFRPIFLLGPVIGLKVGANLEMKANGLSESNDISDGYKSLNLGFLGGVGFAARVGETSSLVVQARYFLGMSNTLDDAVYEASSQDFGIFAGMEFPVGKKSAP